MNLKRAILIVLFVVSLLTTGLAQSQEAVKNDSYYPGKEWRVSTPEAQGMDSQVLLKMMKAFGSQGLILIVRHGYLVTDYDPTDLANDRHHIHSCTKSVISLLVGEAVKEGAIKDIDRNVFDFFPEYQGIRDERTKRITLRHLLTMSSGTEWSDSNNPSDSAKMSETRDWVGYVLNKPTIHEPGEVWNYNSGGSHLVSVILEKSVGKAAEDYAREKLFKPLGITNINWWRDPQGHSTAGWGLHLSEMDLSKLGYLLLREGLWKSEQLIPSSWISESTRRHYSIESGFGQGFGYGYQWWVYTDLPVPAYKAWGSYGTHSVHIIVIPDLDMVVVLAGENGADKNLLKSFIIPSVKSEKPLPPKPALVKELKRIIEQSTEK